MSRRALVTGATGFMGRHLCHVLRARGTHVVALSRAGSGPVDADDRIELTDVLSVDAVEKALERACPDTVFHLAGSTDASSPLEMYRVNTLFGLGLIRCAARLSTRPVVLMTGSVAEYGPSTARQDLIPETAPCQPASPYGISKLAQTLHCLAEYGDSSIVARLFNPVGTGMRSHLALGNFARQLAVMGPQGGDLRTGSLSAVRDFIDARATAECLADLAMTPGARGGIFNVCSGVGTSLRDIVAAMIDRTKKPVRLIEDASLGSLTSGQLDHVVGNPARLRELGLTPPGLDVAKLAGALMGEP